jgi:hypothetical protein
MWLHLGHEVVMKTPLPQARVVLRPSNIDACPPLPMNFPFEYILSDSPFAFAIEHMSTYMCVITDWTLGVSG